MQVLDFGFVRNGLHLCSDCTLVLRKVVITNDRKGNGASIDFIIADPWARVILDDALRMRLACIDAATGGVVLRMYRVEGACCGHVCGAYVCTFCLCNATINRGFPCHGLNMLAWSDYCGTRFQTWLRISCHGATHHPHHHVTLPGVTQTLTFLRSPAFPGKQAASTTDYSFRGTDYPGSFLADNVSFRVDKVALEGIGWTGGYDMVSQHASGAALKHAW